jgi:hypothetical protein
MQEVTSESRVRRYESRWQARSPTTRLLEFGASRGILSGYLWKMGRFDSLLYIERWLLEGRGCQR